jgi:hypothetical protein
VRVRADTLDFVTMEEWQQRHGSTIPIYIEVDNALADSRKRESSLFACDVETRGLQEKAISFVDISPGEKCLDPQAPTFCWITENGKLFTTLRFHDRSTDSYFDIILSHPHTGYRSQRSGSLGVAMIYQLQGTEIAWPKDWNNEWKPSDRVKWHDPTGKIRIKVATRSHGNRRRKLTLKGRTYEVAQTFKVSIDWDAPGDASCYEPISLARLTRSQALETGVAATE